MTQTATRVPARGAYASEPTLFLLFPGDRAPGCPSGAHSQDASTAAGTERWRDHWPPEGWPQDGWPPPELLPEQYWNAAMWEST
jgi:hypothetical protein